MSRMVLLVHPDEGARRELRAWLQPAEVTEAATLKDAVAALERGGVGLVLSWPGELRRLFKDLDRLAPATPRAVLCPDDAAARASLSRLVAEGQEFVTLAATREQVRALVFARASARVVPARPLFATVRFLDGVSLTLGVAEVGNDGLGLVAPAGLQLDHFVVGAPLEVVLEAAPGGQGDPVLMEPGPWRVSAVRREPGGSAHVGLEFSLEPRRAAGAPDTDAVRISGWLQRAALKQQHVDVAHVDGHLRERFPVVTLDEATGEVRLAAPGPRPARWQVGDVVQLAFDIGRLHTECVTTVGAVLDDGLRLAAPRLATQHERRRSLRMHFDARVATLTFRSPLDGARSTRRLLDLEPRGAAFSFDANAEAFPPGLRLRDVELDFDGRRVECEAVVTSTSTLEGSTRRCGVRLRCVSPESRQVLVDALSAWLVPETRDGDEVPFATTWQLFVDEQAHFADHPPKSARTVLALSDAQARLKADGGLGRSFVFRDGGEVVGHAAGLRLYSRTWFSQHLLVRSGFHRQAHVSQALVNLTFDYGEALDDVEYLRGAWGLANRWAARVYGLATPRLVRAGASYLEPFHVLQRPAVPAMSATPLAPGRLVARETREGADFLRLARARHDPVKLAADDLTADELFLPTISARYARAGLVRERRLAVVDDGAPRGWVLVEDMSRGLFWREYYTSARFYLVDPDGPDALEVLAALASFAAAHDAQRGRTVTRCIAAPGQLEALARLGYEELVGASLEFCAHVSMAREMTAELLAIFERLELRAALRSRRSGGAVGAASTERDDAWST